MAQLLEGHRRFGLAHPDKGLVIPEWGTVEDPAQPGRKAAWIRAAGELFKQPRYEPYWAVLQWGGRSSNGDDACEFDYVTSPSSGQAWREMGNDAIYRRPKSRSWPQVRGLQRPAAAAATN